MWCRIENIIFVAKKESVPSIRERQIVKLSFNAMKFVIESGCSSQAIYQRIQVENETASYQQHLQ